MPPVISYEEQTPVDQNGHVVVDIGSVNGVTGATIPVSGTVTSTPSGTQTVTGNTGRAISASISTTALLLANGVYNGATLVNANQPLMHIDVIADQAGSLAIQAQLNGNWYTINTVAIAANAAQHIEQATGTNGVSYRVVYTNGATAQTAVFALYYSLSS